MRVTDSVEQEEAIKLPRSAELGLLCPLCRNENALQPDGGETGPGAPMKRHAQSKTELRGESSHDMCQEKGSRHPRLPFCQI